MIILILLHSTSPNIVTGTCNLMIFTQCTEMSMPAGLYLTQNTLILKLESCNCFQLHFSKVKKRNFLKQLTHISIRKGFLAAGIISNKNPWDIMAFTLFSVILILLFHFPYEHHNLSFLSVLMIESKKMSRKQCC